MGSSKAALQLCVREREREVCVPVVTVPRGNPQKWVESVWGLRAACRMGGNAALGEQEGVWVKQRGFGMGQA